MKVIITGSQAYGPVREDSDIDIVTTRSEAEYIENCVIGSELKYYRTEAQKKQNYTGFYFDVGPIKINIIVADEYWEVWGKATERMMHLPAMHDRHQRIDTFQAIFQEEIEDYYKDSTRQL